MSFQKILANIKKYQLYYLALLLIAVFWTSNVFSGFFRYDDFEILSVARDYPILEQIFILHGDHAMPLFRVEMTLMRGLFGVSPLPYNIAVFLILFGVVVSGVELLKMCKVQTQAISFYILVLLSWHGWSVLVTGYYVLSVYLQIILFSNLALITYVRLIEDRKVYWLFLFILFQLGSVFIDTAGLIALPTTICFSFFHTIKTDRKLDIRAYVLRNKLAIVAFLIVVILYSFYHYEMFVNRYPNSFLNMKDESGSDGIPGVLKAVIEAFLYGHIGSLPGLNIGFPLIHHPKMRFILTSLITVTGVIYLLLKTPSEQRPFLIYAALILAGSLVFVNLGRPGTHHPKHITFNHFYFCILLGLTFDHILKSLPSSYLKWSRVVIALVFLSNPLFTYPFNQHSVKRAENVSAAVTELSSNLAQKVLCVADIKAIPTLEGSAIYKQYGDILSVYDLSNYLDFFPEEFRRIELVRTNEMKGIFSKKMRVVDDLKSVVSPEFIALLSSDSEIQEYYQHSAQVMSSLSRID